MIYHAGKEEVEYPHISKAKYTKDFSWGFYCINDYEQAVRWAKRGSGMPIINYYEFTENANLNILKFQEMTDEWLDFIADCRSGKLHSYDIVEGPMADDTVWNFVNDYLNQELTREQFWVLAKFKYPTHQVSFHTISGLDCLKFERSERIADE